MIRFVMITILVRMTVAIPQQAFAAISRIQVLAMTGIAAQIMMLAQTANARERRLDRAGRSARRPAKRRIPIAFNVNVSVAQARTIRSAMITIFAPMTAAILQAARVFTILIIILVTMETVAPQATFA